MKAPRSIAFYIRVSTVSQDYPSQLLALREFCRRQGWKQRPTMFAEKASGAKANRTQLDRLLQACRDGKIDTIVCYRLDRMGRSFVHLVNLQAELERLKIRMIGVADGIDTSIENAAANLFRNMLQSGAQFQREVISENSRAGIAAARARGVRIGRPRKNDAKIARALTLRAQGKSGIAISCMTGLSTGYLSRLFAGQRIAKTPAPNLPVSRPAK